MTAELSEYQRLSYLGDKVKSGAASKEETNEFMDYMYAHGKIDKEQYDNYKAGRNVQNIINATLAVGAVFLMAYLIDELFSRK
ncbi:MAG: hypothetical protein V4450_06910 [Bacteroidota bacterium]